MLHLSSRPEFRTTFDLLRLFALTVDLYLSSVGVSLFLHVCMSPETLSATLKSSFSYSQTRDTESTWAGPDNAMLFCPISGLHIFRGLRQHVSPLLHDMIQRLYLFSSSLCYSHWQSFLPDHLLCSGALAVSEGDGCLLSLHMSFRSVCMSWLLRPLIFMARILALFTNWYFLDYDERPLFIRET